MRALIQRVLQASVEVDGHVVGKIDRGLYDVFCSALAKELSSVATGVFGAPMRVRLINDGPVTLLVEQ